ncbi:MAG: tetratricopeptide repeat protein [Verrucomicrobiota bacterium]
MITRAPMLAIKNRALHGAMLSLALAVFICGCAPPGERALLAGKKLLERGDYAGAVAQLKTAVTLLATNAPAWNYYGVALQHAGQLSDAAQAYQNALKFDRDLVEAHFNLGCLWLEQNRPDAARTEFTAYTLRRGNEPEGWLKLGAAQLKLRDLVPAEKSFSTALSLNTNNAGALNGLGLARVAGGHPQDAAQFFSAAVRFHPNYAPALLNLATVDRQYLRDDAQALKNYRAYLALTPRPSDWDAVNDLVKSLEQPAMVAAVKFPPAMENATEVPAKPNAAETKPATTAAARPSLPPKAQPGGRNTPVAPHPATPAEIVAVQPEPAMVTTPNASAPKTQVEPATTGKTGAWQRLNPVRLSGSSTQSENYTQTGVTPLTPNPGTASATPPSAAAPVVAAPVKLLPPAPPAFPRYLYRSPPKPKAGDRKAAAGAFDDAQKFEKKPDLTQAMNSYRKAAELDPAWFEAQYNHAALACQLRDFDHSLSACETALALKPDSVDARYTFALALKSAGYATDAVNELKKIVAANPDEARAQLALGNLYAQQMRDPAQARPHYLKWLALDPHNPQATNIRFWLSANPQ